MDMTDISTELARRVGMLEDYVSAITRGAAGCRLTDRDGTYDYALPTDAPPKLEEVWDAVCKAASHGLSDGDEVHDLDWFRENAVMLRPFPQLQWYLYPAMREQAMRFEMPYQERIQRHGAQHWPTRPS